MRTGMEAVYTLLDIDRGVPEVWGSTYDVRCLIDATVKLRDGKKLTDMDLPFIQRVALKEVLKKIEGTDLEKFLKAFSQTSPPIQFGPPPECGRALHPETGCRARPFFV
jgi:oleate hydratase